MMNARTALWQVGVFFTMFVLNQYRNYATDKRYRLRHHG